MSQKDSKSLYHKRSVLDTHFVGERTFGPLKCSRVSGLSFFSYGNPSSFLQKKSFVLQLQLPSL